MISFAIINLYFMELIWKQIYEYVQLFSVWNQKIIFTCNVLCFHIYQIIDLSLNFHTLSDFNITTNILIGNTTPHNNN